MKQMSFGKRLLRILKQNVNIVCVCVGDKYNKEHVNRLHRMVERNCSLPFSFYCISDQQQDVNTIFIDEDLDLESYWWKICLFNLDWDTPTVYFDLDVVIHNNIDNIFERVNETILTIKAEDIGEYYPYDGSPENILTIPPAVINTSIIGFVPRLHKSLYSLFLKDVDSNIITYYGLDRFLYENYNKFSYLDYGVDYYHRAKGYSGQLINDYNYNPSAKVCILSQCTEQHYRGLEKYFL